MLAGRSGESSCDVDPTGNNRAGTGTNLSDVRVATFVWIVLLGSLGLGAAIVGCAGVESGGRAGTGGTSPVGNTGGTSGIVGSGGNASSEGRGGGGGATSWVAGSDGGQVVGCDGGDACMCPPFKLAVIGKPGKWGANPNGDPDTALQDWLNSSSAGTAQVDNFTARPSSHRGLLGQLQRDQLGVAGGRLEHRAVVDLFCRRSRRFPRVGRERRWGHLPVRLLRRSRRVAPVNQLIGVLGDRLQPGQRLGHLRGYPDLQLHAFQHPVRVEPNGSGRRDSSRPG